MAHGDTDLIRTVTASIAKSSNTWEMCLGYQPGKVIMAVAFKHEGKVFASEIVLNVDDVDTFIDRIKATKALAMRARQ